MILSGTCGSEDPLVIREVLGNMAPADALLDPGLVLVVPVVLSPGKAMLNIVHSRQRKM